jgi:hypothetical protein
MTAAPLTAAGLVREIRYRQLLIVVLAGGMALLLTLAAGSLAGAERTQVVLPALICAAIPLLIWRKFSTAVFGLVLLAFLIEQYHVGVTGGDITDRVPLFTSLSDGVGLSGVYLNPFELALAGVMVVLLLRIGLHRTHIPRTHVTVAIAGLLVAVAFGAVHGLGSGGDYKLVLWETRPYVYLATMYLFTVQLPADRRLLRTLLWVFVAGVAVKTAQGLVLTVSILRVAHRPDTLMTHEDSLFFMLFAALVAALWLFQQRGRLRTVTTALLPAVFIVNLANNRRISWLMLGGMLVLLLVVGWVRLPNKRGFILAVVGALAVVLPVYLPLYWNGSGFLSQPARALRSAISPSNRDDLSDQYRVAEDANLRLAIRRSPILGTGYGIPLQYAVNIVDLTDIDPFIKYLPHNDILYVWWRLGLVGAFVFWVFVGGACTMAARLVRSADRELALFGAFCLCALLGYLLLGYLDMGLYWFRVAVFMGCLLGVMQRMMESPASAAATVLTAPSAEREPRAPRARRPVLVAG